MDGAALSELTIRDAEPDDHARVIAVLDEWWGGRRRMRDMLPRLFFVHFRGTSFVAERDGELAGFLVGFLSQAEPDEAYVHFVGVSPARARLRARARPLRALLRCRSRGGPHTR